MVSYILLRNHFTAAKPSTSSKPWLCLQSRVDSWIDFARLLEAPLASWLQPGSAQAQQYSQVSQPAQVARLLWVTSSWCQCEHTSDVSQVYYEMVCRQQQKQESTMI